MRFFLTISKIGINLINAMINLMASRGDYIT